MTVPLVSIIIPVYNSARYLNDTLNSVLNQQFKDWELIIVDDRSTDNSVEIMKRFSELDDRIFVIEHKKNSGVSEARNSGIKISKGKYITFLDSDDIWDDEKLAVQLIFMIEHNCVLSHTAYRKIDEEGKILNPSIPVSKSVSYRGLLKHNEIGLSTSMYYAATLGKRYFGNIGRTDFIYWLNILKSQQVSLGIDKPLVSYRIHKNSLSYNKLKSALKTWQVYRSAEKLPLLSSIYYFACYAVNAGLKYLK